LSTGFPLGFKKRPNSRLTLINSLNVLVARRADKSKLSFGGAERSTDEGRLSVDAGVAGLESCRNMENTPVGGGEDAGAEPGLLDGLRRGLYTSESAWPSMKIASIFDLVFGQFSARERVPYV